MNYIIDIGNDTNENLKINLNNKVFEFQVRYNFIGNYWNLSILLNDNVILNNAKLVQGIIIGNNLTSFLKEINGSLYVYSYSNDYSTPTLNDFGKDKDKVLVFTPNE